MQRAGAGTAESAPRPAREPVPDRATGEAPKRTRRDSREHTRHICSLSRVCAACGESAESLRESLLSAAQSLVSRLVWRGCALCVSACVSHRDVSRRVETRESRHESRERASQQRHRLPVKVCEILHLLKLLPPRPLSSTNCPARSSPSTILRHRPPVTRF